MDMQIKNITLEVGYESASSVPPKKKFGKLPSEVRPVYALIRNNIKVSDLCRKNRYGICPNG
jgi:hypothetical protein